MHNLVGSTLCNRYFVRESIGRGGMAEVYKVWDTKKTAMLVMKLLREDLAQDMVFLRRFRREAQTLASLEHPNIVRFYGLEQDDLLAFMLMDYIDGDSLRTEIFRSQGKGMDFVRILDVMRPVGWALQYAHTQGVVHCDVKPANILINKGGGVFVSDFGIARLVDVATSTLAGAGTPAYMSLEQIKGKDPTPQMDIYSLGVMLYEILTGGERPFTGESGHTTGTTAEKVIWEKMNMEPPSPRQYRAEVTPEIEGVVMKCLAREPEGRYGNVFDFLNALEKVIIRADTVNVRTSDVLQVVAEEQARREAEERVRKVAEVTQEEAEKRAPMPVHKAQHPEVKPVKSWWGRWGVWVGVGGIGLLVVGFLMILALGWGMTIFNRTAIAQRGESRSAKVAPTVEVSEGTEPTIEPLDSSPSLIPPTALVPTATLTPTLAWTSTPELEAGSTQVSTKDNMVMVYVPAGKFIMGSETYADEKPQRTVTLDAFWIDQTEVTNAMYARCMETGACRATKSARSYMAGYENYPVAVDSWDQAQSYCQYAGSRLPTEAEWEKAARGTNGGTYPWGEGANCGQANYGKCTGEVQPVGSYPDFASPYGALDMAGNLWEWVADLYPGTTDYVQKGGDWQNLAWGVRSAVRGGDWASKGNLLWGGSWDFAGSCYGIGDKYYVDCPYRIYLARVDVGFRCALSP